MVDFVDFVSGVVEAFLFRSATTAVLSMDAIADSPSGCVVLMLTFGEIVDFLVLVLWLQSASASESV